MADLEHPDLPPTPNLTPHMLVGAVSPLWTYFGAAAMGGVAYWWMTRWTDRANLEAMFGRAAAVEAAPEVVETAEASVETAVEALAEPPPEAPVGGEAAPMSPVIAALATPEPDVLAEPEAIVSPEPEVVAAPEPEAAPPAGGPPLAMEATADPLPEPAAKPRVRKGPPANGLEA